METSKIATEFGSLTVRAEGPEVVSIVVDEGTGAARAIRLDVEQSHLLVAGLQEAIQAALDTDACLICGRSRFAHDELDASHEYSPRV